MTKPISSVCPLMETRIRQIAYRLLRGFSERASRPRAHFSICIYENVNGEYVFFPRVLFMCSESLLIRKKQPLNSKALSLKLNFELYSSLQLTYYMSSSEER